MIFFPQVVYMVTVIVFFSTRASAMARRKGSRNKAGGAVKGKGIRKRGNVSCLAHNIFLL